MASSDSGDNGTHRYHLRFGTGGWKWLYIGLATFETLRALWAIAHGRLPLGSMIYLALLGLTFAFARRRARSGRGGIELSEAGVRWGPRQANWNEIERIEQRPPPLRVAGKPYDAFVLRAPKPISKALVVSGKYQRIPFGYSYRDWRDNGIADDIRRWAPRLLK